MYTESADIAPLSPPIPPRPWEVPPPLLLPPDPMATSHVQIFSSFFLASPWCLLDRNASSTQRHAVPCNGSAIQCSVIQCNVMQCNEVQCSAVQCSAVSTRFSANGIQCRARQREWKCNAPARSRNITRDSKGCCDAMRLDAMQDRHRRKSGRREERDEPPEYEGKVTDAKDFAPVPKKVKRSLCYV